MAGQREQTPLHGEHRLLMRREFTRPAAASWHDVRHQLVLRHIPEVSVTLLDMELNVVLIEGARAEQRGWTKDGVDVKPWVHVLPADLTARLGPTVLAAQRGATGTLNYESPYDGSFHEIEVVPYRPDADGPVAGVVLVARDVTAEKRVAGVAKRAERRFQGAFYDAPIGMALVDGAGVFEEVNDALCAMTGYARDELTGACFEAITHPDDREANRGGLVAMQRGEQGVYVADKRYVRKDGEIVWVALSATLIRDEHEEPTHVLAQMVDITDRRQLEERLRELADRDALTGLANRRRFDIVLRQHADLGQRYGAQGAVLMLDVDTFKAVNDSLGHAAGDQVLITVAEILGAALRQTDVIARLGGDEFAVLLPYADREQASLVAESIVRAVRDRPLEFGDQRRSFSVSIGAALLADHPDPAAALADADRSLYLAKAAGRDGYAWSDAPSRDTWRSDGGRRVSCAETTSACRERLRISEA